MRKNRSVYIIVIGLVLIFNACSNTNKSSVTEKPTLKDYKIGEKWTWEWKRSVKGEVRAKGKTWREVVNFKGVLGFSNGTDTTNISNTLDVKPTKTPFYDWPLKVGKKWKFEMKWKNNEGTKGKTNQDAVIKSFNEVTVAAGKFMAYKIEYKGRITNSRGYDAKIEDVWWYAPAIKTYIKHTQDDGEGLYVKELINYTNVQ